MPSATKAPQQIAGAALLQPRHAPRFATICLPPVEIVHLFKHTFPCRSGGTEG